MARDGKGNQQLIPRTFLNMQQLLPLVVPEPPIVLTLKKYLQEDFVLKALAVAHRQMERM